MKENHNSLASFFLQKQNNILVLILLALVFLLYSSIFKNHFTNWDEIYLLNNPYLKSLAFANLKNIFTSYYSGNYHPLTLVSLAIDYKIGGVQPWPYQVANLTLHLFNILLVFFFTKSLLRLNSTGDQKDAIIPVITASLFGIHTLQVESVAWISERKNVLYAFFFLLSLIAYIKYLNNRSYKFYFLSLLLFILSLLSKGMAVPLSICIIVIDYYAGRKILSGKVILEKIPFLMLALVFGYIAIKAQHSIDAVRSDSNYTLLDRLAAASYGFIQYMVKLCFPYRLSAFYPYALKSGTFLPYQFYACIALIFSLLFVIWKYLRFNKAILFGILFFLANISIVIQFLPVGDAIISDRYVYIASIGFFFIIGYCCSILWQKKAVYRNGLIVLLMIYCAILSIKTYQRVGIWRNSFTLWSDAVKNYPANNDRGFQNLGIIYYETGNYSAALQNYDKVLRMRLQNKIAYSKAYIGKGQIKQATNDLAGAMNDYNAALSFCESYEGYYNRAVLKMELQDFGNALADLNNATRIDPFRKEAYINRGVIFSNTGDFAGAIQNFNKALEIDPQDGKALLGRGQAKRAMNDLQGAMSDFNNSISHFPTCEGYIERAVLKMALNDFNGARYDLNKACAINPLKLEVYINRGVIELNLGNKTTAMKEFNKALEINRLDFRTYLYRAFGEINVMDYQGAIADLDTSIQLQSNAVAFYYRGIAKIRIGRKSDGCADLTQSAQMGNTAAQTELKQNCK